MNSTMNQDYSLIVNFPKKFVKSFWGGKKIFYKVLYFSVHNL